MHPLVLAAAVVVAVALVVRRRRLSRRTLAAGAVLAAALAAVGVGLVPLPDIAGMIERVGRTLGPWTYLFVGLFAFFETGAFVGLIAPGETAVLVGGLVAGQGEISLVVLIALVWTCAVAGDLTSYVLGRRLGRAWLLRHGERVKITEERLHEVEGFFDRHGGSAIVIGRFIGLVRSLAPFIAGTSRMPVRRFVPYDVLGAGLWAATFSVLGYVFWRSLDRVTQYAGAGAAALGAVVGGVALAFWIRRLDRDPAYRRRVAAWVRERPGGPRLLALWPRVARPLRFAYDRLTPGDLGLELTTLLALAAVGAFAFAVLAGDRFGFDATAADMLAPLRHRGAVVDAGDAVAVLGALAVAAAATLGTAGWLAWHGRRLEAATLVVALALTAAVAHAASADERAALAVALVGCAVALVRAGHGLAVRFAAVTVAVVAVALVAAARIVVREDDLSGVLAGVALGTAIYAASAIPPLVVTFIRHNHGRP